MSQVFTKSFIKIVSPSKPESRDETARMWGGEGGKADSWAQRQAVYTVDN